VKRVAVAVLLLALVGVAACGQQAETVKSPLCGSYFQTRLERWMPAIRMVALDLLDDGEVRRRA